MSHARRQALHDKEVHDFMYDIEVSAKRILKSHSQRREASAMREKAAARRRAAGGSATPKSRRSLPTAPGLGLQETPEDPRMAQTAPSFVMDGGARRAWETPKLPQLNEASRLADSAIAATAQALRERSKSLPSLEDSASPSPQVSRGAGGKRWPKKLQASPLMRTLSSSLSSTSSSSAASHSKTLAELTGASDASDKASLSKSLSALSHSHNADHMVERRMCHACMTDPSKLTQTENGLRSLAQNARHGVEMQGPTSWSSRDLRQKYRCEEERARVCAAMEDAMEEARQLEAEEGVVVPVATVDRHPLPVVFERLLETVNTESQVETRRRNALKVFIFNVHDIWCTNLEHLRELREQSGDAHPDDRAALPPSAGFSSAGSGVGLRGRRDVAAIERQSSQVQSVSVQRAIAGGYYSTASSSAAPQAQAQAQPPTTTDDQPTATARIDIPDVSYALENEPVVIDGRPMLLTIAVRLADDDAATLVRLSAYDLLTGCEPTMVFTDAEARKAVADAPFVARLGDSPMAVVARRTVNLGGRRIIVDARVGEGACGSVAVDFVGYVMHDDERGAERHVLHATGRIVLGVIAHERERERAEQRLSGGGGGDSEADEPAPAPAPAADAELLAAEADADAAAAAAAASASAAEHESQKRLKKGEVAERPLEWWQSPARASLWARAIGALTWLPVHDNARKRDAAGLLLGSLVFPADAEVLEPQKLMSVIGVHMQPPRSAGGYPTPELVVPNVTPADSLQFRAAANDGRDWERQVREMQPELMRSLSFQVSGREDLADAVPGTTDVGQLGLWFKYAGADAEYTQPVGLFFRDPLLSSSNSVMVVVGLALDTPLLSPLVTAWLPDAVRPQPAPHERPNTHTPVVNVPPSTTGVESRLDTRVPATVVVLNGAALEPDWADVPGGGHRRQLPELTDDGFRRKALARMQRPYATVHPCVFGITQRAAAPNAVATNGRQTWHSETVTDQVLIRVRTAADYKPILESQHSSSNEAQCFTLFLSHEEERAIVAVGVTEYMHVQRKLEEEKARREAEAEVQARIEAANRLAQKQRRDRHRIERQLRKKELDRRRKQRGKDVRDSILHDWDARLEGSELVATWTEWEARRDGETGAVFYHCTDANVQEAANQWDPPAEWPEDLLALVQSADGQEIEGEEAEEKQEDEEEEQEEETPELRTVKAMVDFLSSNDAFIDALAAKLGLVRADESDAEEEAEDERAERELQQALEEREEARRVAAEEDRVEKESAALVPSAALMSKGGVLPRRSNLTPADRKAQRRQRRRRAQNRRDKEARLAAQQRHATVSDAVAQGGPNAAGVADNLYGDHGMDQLPGELSTSDDPWSGSDDDQSDGEFDVVRREVEQLNLLRVPELPLRRGAGGAGAGGDAAPLVRDWRRLKATRLPVGFVTKVKRPMPVRARETQLNTPNAATVVGLVDAATATSYTVPYLQNTPPTLFVKDIVADLERVLAKQTHLTPAQRNVTAIDYDEDAPRAGATAAVPFAAQGPTEDQKFEWVQRAVSYVRNGRVPELEQILDEGIPVDSRDEHGNTLFILAVQQGNRRMAKFCLKRGATIDAQNLNGNTALHYAKAYHFDELFDYLIEKGADEGVTNARGYTCYEGLHTDELAEL